MMLGGSCSSCCINCQSLCPSGQSLPSSVLVTFSGLPDSFETTMEPEGVPWTIDCGGVQGDIDGVVSLGEINGVAVSLPYVGQQSAGLCKYAGCVNGRWVEVLYNGPSSPPTVSLGGVFTENGFGPGAYFINCPIITFTPSGEELSPPYACNPFSFTASTLSAYARIESLEYRTVTMPSGSVTVAPETQFSGRCWATESDSIPPATITISITGAEDRESRVRASPDEDHNQPGIAIKCITKLEFLNGTYEMQYIPNFSTFGGCDVRTWAYCFPEGPDGCGLEMWLRVPRYAGGASIEFKARTRQTLVTAVTPADSDIAPGYPEVPADDCSDQGTGELVVVGSLGRLPILYVGEVGWSTLSAKGFASGFCVNGASHLEFLQPNALLYAHSAVGLRLRSFPNDPAFTEWREIDGKYLEQVIEDGPMNISATITSQDNEQPPGKLTLKLSAPYGSGASGVAEIQPPNGTLASPELVATGSGYARFGRTTPSLSFSSQHGTGATFAPTFVAAQPEFSGFERWRIESVSVSGGVLYGDGTQTDGTPLVVTVTDGGTQVLAATLRVLTDRFSPSLKADVPGGSGALLTVNVAENYSESLASWGISEIDVDDGGTGYTDGATVAITPDEDTATVGAYPWFPAVAYARTARAGPTLSASVSGSGGGAGISPTLTQATYWDGIKYWEVTAFAITNGGSGYSVNDAVSVSVDDGQGSGFNGVVSAVSGTGAITAISIANGGEYFKDTGVIESVQIADGGAYWAIRPSSVEVAHGGIFYKEDASLPPYVAGVTVEVLQPTDAISQGSGAAFTASVNDDTESESFGRIEGITLLSGGSGYSVRVHQNACDANPFP